MAVALRLPPPRIGGCRCHAERVRALLVVQGALDIAGVKAQPVPFVRFSLDDRGLAFTLYVTVRETADGGLVQQELRKRAIERLRHDQIALAPVNPFAKGK